MTLEDIFLAAVEKAPADRAAYLDAACGSDAGLRAQVEALLRSHEEAGSLLEQPLFRPGPTVAEPSPTEQPGVLLGGRYKLLEEIGEGGMGSVWMAQQTEPVRRVVAVKLIKAGMDSKQVLARFEAERQALALMDHPNIARVLDGGTTGAGRPYFVMDLVKGVPITRYCDEHRLTPRQRLELFLPVCQAVQHAHQKGIIHRDLKPSNVLVAPYDGKPVVKVIDFGVAKAAGQPLTDKTLVTGFGNIVGTLEYMSPEQAELNNHDIDTRSDIYALGVLLYELLVGSPPFSRQELEKVGMLEMLRVIREKEPSKPSTKLSTAEGLPTLAANRGTEPAKLTRLVRGELDWIVMKALEKDRNRRYETANGFAMDIQRYLADEAVLACPPSAGYRLQKFARRNKGGLAVAALVLFLLVLLGIAIGWAVRDRSAREAEAAQQQAARQGKVAGQVESIFAEVDRLEAEQKWPEALAAARRGQAAVAGGEADEATAERVRQRLKDLEFIDRLEQIRQRLKDREFIDRLEQIRMEQGTAKIIEVDRAYAQAFRDYGVDVEELPVETSIERLKARPVLALPLAVALDEWADPQRTSSKGDDAGWKRLVAVAHGIDPEPLRDRLRSIPWPAPPETQEELRRLADSIDVRAHHPATLHRLAVTLQGAHPSNLAIRVLREAQAAYPGDYWLNYERGFALKNKGYSTGQQQHLHAAIRFLTVAVAVQPSAGDYVNYELGFLLHQRGDLDQAVAFYRGTAHYAELGSALRAQGKLDDAIAAYHKAIEAKPEGAGAYWGRIADVLHDQKKPAEAADAYRQAVAAYRQAIEARPGAAVQHFNDLGRILRAQGQPDDEIAFYREAIAAGSKAAAVYWNYLGKALQAQGKLDEAIATYHQAIEARPEGAGSYWAAIGRILQAQGNPDEAVAAFHQAVEKGSGAVVDMNPWQPAGLWRAIGDIRFAQGKSDEAIAAYRRVIDLELASQKAGPGPVDDPVRNIGSGLRGQGKLDEAVAVYRLGVEVVPEHAHAYWHAIGDTRRDQKKLDEAVEAYRKAIGLKPGDAGHHHGLGLALRDQKKVAEANVAFDRALELSRQAPDVTSAGRHWGVGIVLRDKGELDGAIEAFRQAHAIAPEYYARDLVDALRARGRLDEALDVYRKAFQADPTSFEDYSEFGNALVQRGKLDEAAAVYRKAIEVAPTTRSNFAASAHFQLGSVLSRQGKRPEAIAAYSRALELDQKNMSGAYNGIGNILCDWGRLDEAVAWYKRAIESNPPNAIASLHFGLGEVLLQQNKFDEAAAAFRKAIDVERNSPRSHQYLAWILASRPEADLRDPKQAIALAKRAVELAQNSEAWQYLGWIHYRTGDWKSSIEALEKSCKLQQGGTGDAGQWIVLALAHARLAAQDGLPDKARELHRIEARRWFEQADKQIANSWRARPDTSIIGRAVWDFREEAWALMRTKESKK
jgi:tetratricopeptide (TPR) repeat protein